MIINMIGELVPIVAITMTLGIPLSAILGSYFIKWQKLKLEQQQVSDKDLLLLRRVLDENNDLKKRLENLELIVTDANTNLRLNANQDSEMRQVVALLKKEIDDLKKKS